MLQLGHKIKLLRKQKDISQETLANYLGVSFQAVSKWENDTCMPDVTLLPAIAYFFDVSTDELLDYNRFQTQQKVDAIVDEYSKYYDTDQQKAEQVLRDGLKQYPGNDILLKCLADVLPLPEQAEEVIELCKSVIKYTHGDDMKYDAYRTLAEAYHAIGQQEAAKAAVEMIPELYFSKLEIAAYILEGKDKYNAAYKQKWLSFEGLLQMIDQIAVYYEEQGEFVKAMDETERGLRLLDAMGDDPMIANFDTYRTSLSESLAELKKKV